MMSPGELMLGDLVYNHRKWVCPVVAIDKDHVTVIAQHYGESPYRWEDIYPIPLTKEILIKNGATTNPKDQLEAYTLDGVSFIEDEDGIWMVGNIGTGFMGDEFHLFTYIKYVHDLQHVMKLHLKVDKKIFV